MPTTSPADVWDAIAAEAAEESPLWRDALRADPERKPGFGTLAEERFRLGIETIYEGYLVHYGRPRLFAPATPETALLLGDYLYAHGLVRIAALGEVGAVADLAELISLCAQLRADGGAGDAVAWAATAALLGRGALAEARGMLRDDGDPGPLTALAENAIGAEGLRRALAVHSARVG